MYFFCYVYSGAPQTILHIAFARNTQCLVQFACGIFCPRCNQSVYLIGQLAPDVCA